MPLQAPFFLAFATTIMANGLVKRQGPDINEDDIPVRTPFSLCVHHADRFTVAMPEQPGLLVLP